MDRCNYHVLGLLLLGFLGTSLPAAGEDLVTDKNWTIVPLGSSCSAINRPLEEFNTSPYNAMAVNASKAKGLELQIYFWPGYVPAEPVELLLATDDGDRFDVIAEPYGDQAVTVLFSEDDRIQTMIEESTVLLAALKSKPNSLTFEIEPLRRLLDQLNDCSGR